MSHSKGDSQCATRVQHCTGWETSPKSQDTSSMWFTSEGGWEVSNLIQSTLQAAKRVVSTDFGPQLRHSLTLSRAPNFGLKIRWDRIPKPETESLGIPLKESPSLQNQSTLQAAKRVSGRPPHSREGGSERALHAERNVESGSLKAKVEPL